MNRSISVKLWFTTWVVLSIGFLAAALFTSPDAFGIALIACFVAFFGSLPSLLLLMLCASLIDRSNLSAAQKITALTIGTLIICICYGAVGGYAFGSNEAFYTGAICTGVLYLCSAIAIAIHYKSIHHYYYYGDDIVDYTAEVTAEELYESGEDNSSDQGYMETPSLGIIDQSTLLESLSPNNTQSIKNNATMEQSQHDVEQPTSSSNKVLIKAAITGGLILVMLIPTLFISNLVNEREQRQKEVVAEVSNKWAKPQTLTGPYIALPYYESGLNDDKKPYVIKKTIVLLPEDLNVSGSLSPEERKRSIYTVLLYKTNLNATGNFSVKLPSEIDTLKLLYNEARLCIGVNDFKGIEEKVSINFNGVAYDLTPGLPSDEINETGLSCSIPLSKDDFINPLPFSFNLKIKGSQQLSFVPLSGNSTFALTSPWPNPSFDGSSLPSEREVTAQGFKAKWAFNKANLPFNTVLKDFKMDAGAYGFGVSMVQPADQYAKTMRSVKYAILFIGLTFSLFFIVELMQKKPVHPVQYVLVGLALVIFYTLLLSISEFVLFDNAYLIAASATVLLITLYAKGHFASWKVAGVFALVLGMLYGFIFVLIRLEDTALLVGSIGLFGVLALVMYASRRINWYNPSFTKPEVQTA